MEIIEAQKKVESILGVDGYVEYNPMLKEYYAGIRYKDYNLILVHGNSWEDVLEKVRME